MQNLFRENEFYLHENKKNHFLFKGFALRLGATLKWPGGTPLYKLYRYVPPHRVGFLRRFGLKTGIHFAHFGLESGMVSEGLRECMNVFIVSITNE